MIQRKTLFFSLRDVKRVHSLPSYDQLLFSWFIEEQRLEGDVVGGTELLPQVRHGGSRLVETLNYVSGPES